LQGHALLRIENCICTPHIGYVEQENYERMFSSAFENVVNFIRGTPSNIVNPGALQVRRRPDRERTVPGYESAPIRRLVGR